MDLEALEVAYTIKKQIDFYLKKQQPADKMMLSSLYTDMGKLSYDNFGILFHDSSRKQASTEYTEKDIKTLLSSLEISNHAFRTMKDKSIDSLSMTLKEISALLEGHIANYSYQIFVDYSNRTNQKFKENDFVNIKSRWTYQKGRDFFIDPQKQVKEWATFIHKEKSRGLER